MLHWWRDRDGRLWLIYEDLLNSERGWDRSPDASVAVAGMAVPKDHEAAMAAWRKLAPTGSDYQDKLAAIPAGPVAQAMAHALIYDDDFVCDEIIEYDQCGEEYSEFKPLPDDADFENACLRRRLALWSLERLPKESVETLVDSLEAIVAMSEPENQLQEAILSASDQAGEAVRLTLLLAAEQDLAAKHLSGLSDAGLVRLYEETYMNEAIALLGADGHMSLLIEALGNHHLRVETRERIQTELSAVNTPEMAAALTELTEADDCGLAMTAAEMLAKRGDPGHLPKKPEDVDVEAHAWALCRLLFDSDSERATERWRAFFPPSDTVDRVDVADYPLEGEMAQMEYEEALERGEDADESAVEEAGHTETSGQLVRDKSTISDLASLFDREPMTCDGMTCSVESDDGTSSVTFEVGADSKLYLSELGHYVEYGCDC